MTYGRHLKRSRMNRYEAMQCDRALVRLADYSRWKALHPGAPYTLWARRQPLERYAE